MKQTNDNRAGYKLTKLGWIPDDWDVKVIGKAFNICNNLRLPISEEERRKIQGDYPYYGPTKIQDYINEYRIEGKYAIIGEDGDHFLKWKELPMTLLIEGKFNVNNHAHIIQGDKNLTEWFFYYFNNKPLTSHLTRQGAGRYKLTKDALSKILCPLPHIEEQKAIASCLSTWDKSIQTITQLIDQKEMQKKWLMQNLLTEKKRLPGFRREWTERKIGELGLIQTGNTPSKNILSFWNGEYNWATADDMDNKYIYNTKQKLTKEGYSNARIAKKNSVLVTCIASIGKNALTMIDTGFNQQINSITPNNEFDAEFVYYLIDFNPSKLMTYAGAGAMPMLNKNVFMSISFKFPRIEEQKAIAKVLQRSDNEIDILKQKRDQIEEQKKGLMQQLLTGKKRLIN